MSVYIVTFEERTGGFEELTYLAVKDANQMTNKELVETMWCAIDNVEDFDSKYNENPYYWVAGNEKLVRVVSKKPITSKHLNILNEYIKV